MLRGKRIYGGVSREANSHLTLVHWLKENSIYHPSLQVVFNFQSKVTFADEAQWGDHILDLNTCPHVHHGESSSTAFSKAVIQKTCIYCFGNHCFQFLLGFQLFSGKAIIELTAEEFIQWLSFLQLKAGISLPRGVPAARSGSFGR